MHGCAYGGRVTRNEIASIIEDIVRRAKDVDAGLRHMPEYDWNAPLAPIDRRRFLHTAAACAALQVLGLQGCATVEHQGKTYENWQIPLMKGDLIHGPVLRVDARTNKPHDFQDHIAIGAEIGGVDYAVPIGTPVTPTLGGQAKRRQARIGGNQLDVFTELGGKSGI
jgi:hypothetical protein